MADRLDRGESNSIIWKNIIQTETTKMTETMKRSEVGRRALTMVEIVFGN